ncbi:hypothetical protein, partial [Streptomyces sp. NPDC094468]|uniref:hypothetical protein n=1 Tax=Streptomyces sp. NPDC094468 TaxID=3366066 RepID=UPI0037FF5E0E
RQHRPIDHDRHTRIMPLARNDASPTITHQLVTAPLMATGFSAYGQISPRSPRQVLLGDARAGEEQQGDHGNP